MAVAHTKQRRSPSRRHARQLVITLAVTFCLTIASFLGSSAISERRSRGIEEQADLITGTAVPGSEVLSTARTELRHIDEALDDIVYRGAGPFTLDDERADLRSHWEQYSALPYLPTPPGEAELAEQTRARMLEMDRSIGRVIARMNAHDSAGAAEELTTKTRPAIRDVSDSLREAIVLNLNAAANAAEEIERLRRSSTSLRLILNAASAVSAIAAAWLAVRVARRFIKLTDERMEEMDRFAGRVAHDIRSPLNTVGLALELARRSPTIDPKTQSILDRGARTMERVDQLIEGLLVFARAGSPEDGAVGTRVDDVLPGVLEDLRRVAEEKQIALELDLSPVAARARVQCSAGVLVSLVSNLVGNSIKYMGDSSERRVVVHARDEGDRMHVDVEDTGPGVPHELQSRIFDPYTRAQHGSIPGLGLGLATVRRLAEAHGGSCGFSPRSGRGSRFWFELPKAAARSEHTPAFAPA